MHHRHVVPLIIFATALVLSGTIWYSANRVPVDAPPSEESARQRTFSAMMRTGSNAVFVDDQPVGALEVFVGFALLEDGGYLEIRADDGGLPGRTIGRSALLPNGGAEHFTVALDEVLTDHAVYYAVLVGEDGSPVTDAEGNVVLMTFAARQDAVPETGVVLP